MKKLDINYIKNEFQPLALQYHVIIFNNFPDSFQQ